MDIVRANGGAPHVLESKQRVSLARSRVPYLKASPCVSNSLAADISLGSCTLGPNLTFEDFGFQLIKSSGIVQPINASDITVAPDSSGTGIDFSSSDFQASGSQSMTFALTYTIVSSQAISQVSSSLVSADVIAPASIDVFENFCLGSAFDNGVCNGPIATINLEDNGSDPYATISPPATTIGGSYIVSTLGNDSHGSIGGIDTTTSLPPGPEPASTLLCAMGLLTLGCGFRLFRRRSNDEDPLSPD